MVGTVKSGLIFHLMSVARALGEDLRDQLVFVGGCTTALFITDEVTVEDVRATDDVDLIADLIGHSDWYKLQSELQDRGFTINPEDEVLCRMRLGRLKVDFMPSDPSILGFTNSWYEQALKTANYVSLSEDLSIRVLTPPLFLATKFEAFHGRGNNDLLTSHDLEDILLLVDGRPEIVDEVAAADIDVRKFIEKATRELVDHRDYSSFLNGNVRGPEGRSEIVDQRFVDMAFPL